MIHLMWLLDEVTVRARLVSLSNPNPTLQTVYHQHNGNKLKKLQHTKLILS